MTTIYLVRHSEIIKKQLGTIVPNCFFIISECLTKYIVVILPPKNIINIKLFYHKYCIHKYKLFSVKNISNKYINKKRNPI